MLTKNQFQSKGLNYGFIEYMESESAEKAMQTLNGRRILQNVRWTKLAAYGLSLIELFRRFVSTGPTSPTTLAKKTLHSTSIFSSEICQMR